MSDAPSTTTAHTHNEASDSTMDTSHLNGSRRMSRSRPDPRPRPSDRTRRSDDGVLSPPGIFPAAVDHSTDSDQSSPYLDLSEVSFQDVRGWTPPFRSDVDQGLSFNLSSCSGSLFALGMVGLLILVLSLVTATFPAARPVAITGAVISALGLASSVAFFETASAQTVA